VEFAVEGVEGGGVEQAGIDDVATREADDAFKIGDGGGEGVASTVVGRGNVEKSTSRNVEMKGDRQEPIGNGQHDFLRLHNVRGAL